MLTVNSKLLVGKFWGSLKLHVFDCAGGGGSTVKSSCVGQGSTVKADLTTFPVDIEACGHVNQLPGGPLHLLHAASSHHSGAHREMDLVPPAERPGDPALLDQSTCQHGSSSSRRTDTTDWALRSQSLLLVGASAKAGS